MKKWKLTMKENWKDRKHAELHEEYGEIKMNLFVTEIYMHEIIQIKKNQVCFHI